MSDELTLLVAELSEKINNRNTRGRAIDLRYVGGQWMVRIEFDDKVTTVRGSLKDSPVEAVKFCLKKRARWPSSMYDFVYREQQAEAGEGQSQLPD